MRESCLHCVIKHLSQAIILNIESELGYPLHKFLAAGHLAEAESESINQFPELAHDIRNLRLALTDKANTLNGKELLSLLAKADQLAALETP